MGCRCCGAWEVEAAESYGYNGINMLKAIGAPPPIVKPSAAAKDEAHAAAETKQSAEDLRHSLHNFGEVSELLGKAMRLWPPLACLHEMLHDHYVSPFAGAAACEAAVARRRPGGALRAAAAAPRPGAGELRVVDGSAAGMPRRSSLIAGRCVCLL